MQIEDGQLRISEGAGVYTGVDLTQLQYLLWTYIKEGKFALPQGTAILLPLTVLLAMTRSDFL